MPNIPYDDGDNDWTWRTSIPLWGDEEFTRILGGATVKAIHANAYYLKLVTDKGDASFLAMGDCCSHCYLWDFLGVRKLLDNGPIVKAYQKDLGDVFYPDSDADYHQEQTSAYGLYFVTEDPQFGEVTSLLSFRNDSNGYYGGSLEYLPDGVPETETLVELTDDCLQIPDSKTFDRGY